jgi:hypothetical protein
MAFIQIVDFETDKIDEMRKLDAEWGDKAPADGPSRGILCADRDNPGRFLQIVFFDSYEAAMRNSDDPITNEFAGKMAALAKGPAKFVNLDVVNDQNY